MKVTKRKAMSTMVISATIFMLIYGVGAWRPKCRYALEGVWLFDNVGSDGVVVVTMSPVDVTGKRKSVATGMLVNSDPTNYGGAQWSLCQMESISTGRYTYESRGVMYLLDDHEQIVLILAIGGTGTWIDENHMEFDFFSTIYTPAQDVNAYGWPDEGQAPIMVNRYSYNVERIGWFPEPA